MQAYLDYAATTPMSQTALQAYQKAALVLGNASSVHRAGQHARELLEEGRVWLAESMGAHPLEVILNSGGTEGDNHVFWSVAQQFEKGHIITSSIEHSAVLAPARFLEATGRFQVTYLTPDRWGRVHPEQVKEALRSDTVLVSIMHANNEVGSVQDIQQIAAYAREKGVLVHTDAVQSLGILPVDVHAWGVDYASFSAHKFYGPTGVGMLYVRRGLELAPHMMAGHQEKGFRGGTHNVTGVYAAGAAAREAVLEQPETHAQLTALKQHLQEGLQGIEGTFFNHAPDSSPKVLSVTVQGADGEALLMNLDLEGVYVSAGSACSAGTMQASHVLLALGLSEEDARSSLRFSLGKGVTAAEIDFAIEGFKAAVSRSRF
ncbi:cysteine desulfurase family protein [Deinococcus roseus]|uniref:cysteine desulfurase n=1 Tax=Deinococcus roseus TaxID=392414 RepID=A0ABQ2CYK9_9DEIO|nr:cysteine desulfurase family protein [Deinococcus roseus]GGJ22468.1 aminotransferase V [Deinococcus roseus]